MRALKLLLLPLAALSALCAAAQTVSIIPGDGDHGAMRGFPPASDRIVGRPNQINPENLRWTLSHARMLFPTANIRRGAAPVTELPGSKQPLGTVVIADPDGGTIVLDEWLTRTHTDALLVLHQGRIVYEGYADGVPRGTPHTLQSISKSFIGIIAAMLIDEGRLAPNAPVARYVPELANSAWGDATVQQTLDMTTAVRYTEDMKDPNSDVHRYYAIASGSFPPPPGYDGPRHIYAMLPLLPREGEHGAAFIYKSVNPEAIAWAVSRITGERPSELISERLWSKLGAEEDAYVQVDPAGTEMIGGGMSVCLHDLARFAEMLRLGGRYNGRQIVPAKVVAEIAKGGDAEKFAKDPLRRHMVGYSYHDFWWKPPGNDGVIEAKGGFGHQIHINPAAGVVVVKFSSNPDLADHKSQLLDAQAFAALDALLRRREER